MYIWYASLYEPLPIGGEGIRKMRSGLLIDALIADGHTVELWIPGFEHVHHEQFRGQSTLEKIDDAFSIQYMRGPGYSKDTSYKRLFHNKAIAKEFHKLADLRGRLPDLILTQVPSLELAEAVMNFARKTEVPYVVDVRDPWPEIYQRLLPDKFKFLYSIIFFTEIMRAKRIFSNASQITAVSLTYLGGAIKYANRSINHNDMVFPIGYPVMAADVNIKPEVEEKYGCFRDKFVVFFAGTFGSNFDVDAVIEASKILDSNENNIHFVIAGKGDGSDLLASHAEASDNFSFLDWVPFSELRYLLSISSVGLAPFPRGAMNSLPNKPYEYMSASLPIIASLDGELKEIIESHHIGMCYKAGDESGLADAILTLYLNNDTLEEMSASSYKMLVEKYDSRIIYKNFSNYLVKIFNERKS